MCLAETHVTRNAQVMFLCKSCVMGPVVLVVHNVDSEDVLSQQGLDIH